MGKAIGSTPCLFLAYSRRATLPRGAIVHDVSSYAEPPYCTLSPMWVHGGIPVPGMPGVRSMQISTSGGATETEVKELTVSPCGVPSRAQTVATATPVAN